MKLKENASLITVLVLLTASLMALPFAQAASVDPVYMAGNPTCADLGYAFEIKLDPPTSGTYNVDGFGSVTLVSADGTLYDWSSTFGIDAVIAKGGDGANVYIYSPESMGDTGLQSPDNASGGPAGLSHVSFCYDVDATPTAIPPTEVPATEVPPTPTVVITAQPEHPTATPVTPTATVVVTVQPENPTATPVTPTATVQITVAPQDNVTLTPTAAPAATLEPAQPVLPAAGTGGAPGGLGGSIFIALALTGGAAAYWRRTRI